MTGGKSEGNPVQVHEKFVTYTVLQNGRRNNQSIVDWKRIVAAVIFNQNGHELLGRQDWGEEKNCMSDFPRYRTFFVLRKEKEGNSQGQPDESMKAACKARSNDRHSSALSNIGGATQGLDRKAECKVSERLWVDTGKRGITGTKWGHESKVTTCEQDQGNRMDMDGIEPLNVQPKCRRVNRWSKHSDARTALEGIRNSNQRPRQEVPERREPNCADVGQPAGTADPAAEGTPDRNLGNTLETFTSKAQEASTQTGSPEEDGKKLTLSTDVVTMKKFVDVGSQTLTDVRGRSWSDDPNGCPDCSEDTGGEKWGPGDLTDIREFAGYTYGEANAQLCDCTIANHMAKELLEHPEQITSDSITEVLNKWQFTKI